MFRKFKQRWRTRVSARSAPSTHRESIKADWREHRYYEQAEQDGWVSPFWGDDSPFKPIFDTLRLDSVVEIGCGRGRHAARIVDRAGRIVLVDINETNIAACRQRFAQHSNVEYICTTGDGLEGIESGAFTTVFSYDAMVHFEAADVIRYVSEAYRVLQSGGHALLHYSNYDQNPGGFYRDNPGHRNFFSERMMRHFADRAGFTVVRHSVFNCGPEDNLSPIDGLILLRR